MPLLASGTRMGLKKNFHELRRGKLFATTEAKYGKETAQKQMDAIVLKNQRKNTSLKGGSGLKT